MPVSAGRAGVGGRMRAAAILAMAAAASQPALAADEAAPVTPALVRAAASLPPQATSTASPFRFRRALAADSDPTFRVDDPASLLRSGYGGALVDLFPFEGGKFHLSGGSRLFGRAGRPRQIQPESLRFLPSLRSGGPRTPRRFSPTMLVGYGQVVDQGFAVGVDAGLVMGRIGLAPDRLGRLARRLDAGEGHGRRAGMNQLARVTALYRF